MESDTGREQTSIPKNKIGRAAKLVGSGAKIGVNYLKYVGKKTLTGDHDKSDFHTATAAETYKTFSKLKGAPLKLAQMLSMDRNMIPEQYVDEFSKAQYSAPPLSYPLVVKTFQQEMGKSPSEIFDTFSNSAVAGASIGQVHKAQIGDTDYAVKIQYPGVANSLHSDLAIVKPIAMKLFQLDAKSIDPYLKEIEARLLEETNYLLERERSEELISQSAHLPNTSFPSYNAELSSRRILTMSWIEGEPLDKYSTSNASQQQRNTVAQALWDFYHHQIHTLRVFHADPHPGNFLIKDHHLHVLDFGCVKELPEDFYTHYFQLMQPGATQDRDYFIKILKNLELIIDSDTEADIDKLVSVFRESIDLLSRPFMLSPFDFSDASYFAELNDFGERAKLDDHLQSLNSARGSAHALYLNRTYFGLYNLCGSLKASVKTVMPEMK